MIFFYIACIIISQKENKTNNFLNENSFPFMKVQQFRC